MPESFNESQDVEFESYVDYVATLRNSCHPDVFEWPAKSRTFDDTISAAMEACPPGCMVVVRNAKAPPEDWCHATTVLNKNVKQEGRAQLDAQVEKRGCR